VFKPAFPPTIATPQKVLEGMAAVKANRTLVVPSFIEHWSKDEASVEFMKGMSGLVSSF